VIKTRGRFHVVDVRWPDGVRSRYRFKDPAKAEERELRIRLSLIDNTWSKLRQALADGLSVCKSIRFSELAEQYLEEYVKVENTAVATKECKLKILKRRFGRLPISSLRPRHVTRYKKLRKEKDKVSESTVNREIEVLKHLLNWAVEEEIIPGHRLGKVKRFREDVRQRPRPTDQVVDEVFKKLDLRVVPLFTFIRETGCRREEALTLKHWQIDLKNQTVVFTPSDTTKTKSRKARNVPLTDPAIEAIRAMPQLLGCDLVFYHPDSLGRWAEARDPWEKARKAAGHQWLQIKDLRRAYGIRLAEAGCPMSYIKEVMGHASVATTEKYYAHYSPQSAVKHVLAVLQGGRRIDQ
jgi:integrase